MARNLINWELVSRRRRAIFRSSRILAKLKLNKSDSARRAVSRGASKGLKFRDGMGQFLDAFSSLYPGFDVAPLITIVMSMRYDLRRECFGDEPDIPVDCNP